MEIHRTKNYGIMLKKYASESDSGVTTYEIKNAINKLDANAQQVIDTAHQAIFKDLIGNAVATKFFGIEIVKVEEKNLVPETEALLMRLKQRMDNLANAIDSNAELVATREVYQATTHSYAIPASLTRQTKEKDESDNGFVGVRSDAIQSVESAKQLIDTKINDELENIKKGLERAGFYGGGVQDALNSSVIAINKDLDQYFKGITAFIYQAGIALDEEFATRLASAKDNLSI